MGKGLISMLYTASRTLGKTASTLNDIKIISTGDPAKIAKRFARKTVNKKHLRIVKKFALKNINKHTA